MLRQMKKLFCVWRALLGRVLLCATATLTRKTMTSRPFLTSFHPLERNEARVSMKQEERRIAACRDTYRIASAEVASFFFTRAQSLDDTCWSEIRIAFFSTSHDDYARGQIHVDEMHSILIIKRTRHSSSRPVILAHGLLTIVQTHPCYPSDPRKDKLNNTARIRPNPHLAFLVLAQRLLVYRST